MRGKKKTSIWGWAKSSHINLRVGEAVGLDRVARGAPLYILKPKQILCFIRVESKIVLKIKATLSIFLMDSTATIVYLTSRHTITNTETLNLFARSWTDLFKLYRGTLCIIHSLIGVERFTQYTLQLERTFTLVLPCSGVTDPKLLNSRQLIRLFSLSLAKPDMKILYARDALIFHKILYNCSILSAYNNVRRTYYRT